MEALQLDLKKQGMKTTPIIPTMDTQEENIILTLLSASAHISRFLRSSPTVRLESSNSFGDQQLHQDVYCDQLVQKYLRANPKIKGFATQERPQYIPIIREGQQNDKEGFIITYDPIDGSSILETNFAIGSIFSIWKYNPDAEKQLIGSTVDQQLGAILVVYGSRTTAITYNSKAEAVQQYTLLETYNHENIKKDQWVLSNKNLKIAPKTKIFSPGNSRAGSDHPAYRQFMLKWIDKGYTLRYSGGLVPDIEHIFIKGNGVFCNIGSAKHKAKLRVLYQIAAVAFLMQKAGGKCIACTSKKGDLINGTDLMKLKIQGYDDRMGFATGSSEQVDQMIKCGCLDGV